MNSNNSIEAGDTVQINYVGHSHCTSGQVLAVPGQTFDDCVLPNDCWHIRRDDGFLIYVQSFEYMTLIGKAGE